MRELLMVIFLLLSPSLQRENCGDLCSAKLVLSKSNVMEGENVISKCWIGSKSANNIRVLLCKDNDTVKTEEAGGNKEDVEFKLDKVTLKDSGWYSCVYSEGKIAECMTNMTKLNPVKLEVLGKILPGNITGTQDSLTAGEDLTLTCSLTVNQTCTEIYVYLCLNGTGKSTKPVKCGINPISAVFLLNNIQTEVTGSYSCFYSLSNYNLSDLKNAAENPIFIQVYGGGQSYVVIVLSVAVAVALVIFGLFCYKDILHFRVCRDPDAKSCIHCFSPSVTPGSDHFYSEIAAGENPLAQNVQPDSSGENHPNRNALYSTVQRTTGRGQEDNTTESTSRHVVYSLLQTCEEKTKQLNTTDYYTYTC
ncbi:uncharacterized protein [Hoplias malabaricus]|uniref:uncharacterized protein isoform X2 n=1 Tax=Hoplias malabaricus TaxID=27720 RepID=UPI0034634035